MSTTVDISIDDALTALRAFLLGVVPESVEVVAGQDNGVPMPLGAFIAMTPGAQAALSVPTTTYDGAGGTRSFRAAKRFSVQLDCYGADSAATATIISTLMRTGHAADALAPTLAPLYTSEPIQLPLVNGEQQYEERWMLSAEFQYNPSITLPQQFAAALSVGVINVDVAYPPGA